MSSFYDEIASITNITNTIYKEENERLNKRKDGINNMMVSQKRLIALNQSYTSKMKKYGYIVSIISFALVIIVMVISFRSLIPSILADLTITIVMAGAIIWCYLIYTDIQNRDKIDFDELAVDSSNLVNPDNIDQKNTEAGNAGDISALANNEISSAGCIGRQCCPADWTGSSVGGTYYNTNLNVCRTKIASETDQATS